MKKKKLNRELIKQIEMRTWLKKSYSPFPCNKFPHQKYASS